MVSLDIASYNLRTGVCSSALNAGCSLLLHDGTWVAMCMLHALAADGTSKTFDASADGYGRGEACIAMVVERHSFHEAVALQSTALNQDGHSASFMASNSRYTAGRVTHLNRREQTETAIANTP